MSLRPAPRSILLSMRVWDGATRLFHWLAVLLFVLSYVSITLAVGKDALFWMRIHITSGETMLALLVFRLIWGVVGSDTSRFARFVVSPLRALTHLRHIARREPDTQIGHNAAGGWMVVFLLALLAAQVVTGLCANDDGSTEGPLAKYIGKAASDAVANAHGIIFNALAAAIVLHIVAIITYWLLKRHNLVRPMITGRKRLPAATRVPRMASPLLAAVTLLVSAAIAVGVALL